MITQRASTKYDQITMLSSALHLLLPAADANQTSSDLDAYATSWHQSPSQIQGQEVSSQELRLQPWLPGLIQ